MIEFKINDRVKQKHTKAERKGTIIGIWENDEYLATRKGKVLFAIKGELKIKFDQTDNDSFVTLSKSELIKMMD